MTAPKHVWTDDTPLGYLKQELLNLWAAINAPVTFITDVDGDTKVQVEESSDEDKVRIDTAGSERVIVDSSGNVGINKTTPSERLDVVGNVKAASGVFIGEIDRYPIPLGAFSLDAGGGVIYTDGNAGSRFSPYLEFPDILPVGTNAFAKLSIGCPENWRGKKIKWKILWSGDNVDTVNDFRIFTAASYRDIGDSSNAIANLIKNDATNLSSSVGFNLTLYEVESASTIGANAVQLLFEIVRQSQSDTNVGALRVHTATIYVFD